jgi:hypothetical protein
MVQKSSKPTIQIALTPEQQAQIQQATGKQVVSLKLEALEERLAPGLGTN